jgi:hypothetical protein
MKIKKNFYIKIQKDKILIYLMQKLFLCQFLISPYVKNISKKVYIFLYITKTLTNYGLIAPSNKKIGF